MVAIEGKDYLSLNEIFMQIGIKPSNRTRYSERFKIKFGAHPIKYHAPGNHRAQLFYPAEEVPMIVSRQIEYSKNFARQRNTIKEPTAANRDHVQGKGDFSIVENRKKGYYTRITGYWHI